jgi:hypothetical protein
VEVSEPQEQFVVIPVPVFECASSPEYAVAPPSTPLGCASPSSLEPPQNPLDVFAWSSASSRARLCQKPWPDAQSRGTPARCRRSPPCAAVCFRRRAQPMPSAVNARSYRSNLLCAAHFAKKPFGFSVLQVCPSTV